MSDLVMFEPGASTSTDVPTNTDQTAMSTTQVVDALECDTFEGLMNVNETYVEILDSALLSVQQHLDDNLKRQQQLKEEYRLYNRADITKRKVPVHLYMPPYFKDDNNMYPPMSSEAREKQVLKWFDPMMKEEKKWTPSEIKTLRTSVKNALVAHQVQPWCSRRDIVASKLRDADITTSNFDRRQWTMELEDLMRKIAYVREKSEEEVLTASADYTVVPWTAIANFDFKGSRTEWAVKSKWYNELNPKWNKEHWSNEEVEKLKYLRESPKFVSWPMLALNLGTNRTSYQCMEKYKTEVSQHSKEWSQDEDTKLIALTKITSINGHIQWDKVAQCMPGRTRQQVRTRFSHTLDASVKHGRWTDQEDVLLVCAVSRYGAKDWAKVAQAVQNRNDSQCRERWTNVLNRSAHVNERFTLVEDEQLLYAVKVFGKGNWAKCQMLLPKKTSRQLRRRYLQLIAAKLRLAAGFCNAVDAMKSGRRAPEEDELEQEDIVEAEQIPNELMKEVYEKFANENPDMNETPEEFYKRVSALERPAAARIRALKNKPDYQKIQDKINEIVQKHKNAAEIDKELHSSEILSSLTITEVDVRYMIERSKTLTRYYEARQFRKNVDQIGCRVRPIKIDLDPETMPTFDPNDAEDEKQMVIVESLCSVIRAHDVKEWGTKFWNEHRFTAPKYAKRFVENMVINKSKEVAEWYLHVNSKSCNQNDVHCPAKSTLPPTAASFDLHKMLQKARSGLNRLSAEHFYPLDVSLAQQFNFKNDEREGLDGDRRMHIGLSDEVTNSKEYANFYARMRSILLEPMRLGIARESSSDETKRLVRCLAEERACDEEQQVTCDQIRRRRMPDDEIYVTPTSISRELNNGMKIDTTELLANLDKNSAKKIRMKRKIGETVATVAARPARPPRSSAGTPTPSHVSIDTESNISLKVELD
ncbi:snRNA-activating protein complex subunit 4 homolog [Caenorhabditis elegans]|uniref:Isoform b of snRNA-activating protein complex subunit 4 homolog n=1 Tax=Caenorhabditis elegans TaxID=6239 RepID=P91868-2|nr:snRNA-activating protein complex subunit 4 homolog [Caenorhabditis elegans]CAB04248.1 snRNA-activating protein complex subunit 4 homolog [Caenorhabditis elegans]|eukprot:NP_492412.1 snRNA-activating protein complex subunit 4 homolog [Caenorhabditis elegans]